MADKCFCHLNGYEVKDHKAREAIELLKTEDTKTSEAIELLKTEDTEIKQDILNLASNKVDNTEFELYKNYVTPEMFGAVCDGVGDDSAAFKSCIDFALQNNLKVIADKTITIKSPLIIDFGGNHLDISASIKPVLETTALTFKNGIHCRINISILNGESENAIKIIRMWHSVIKLDGYYHNGCLLRVEGNDQDDTHNLALRISIKNFNCKQTLYHSDPIPSSGFGEYEFVWEETWDCPYAVGSLISNCGDVTINHWESHFVTEIENQTNLKLQALESCYINYLALGGKCASLLKVSYKSDVFVNQIHLASEDGTNVNGMQIDSLCEVHAKNIKLVNVGVGIDIATADCVVDIDVIRPNDSVSTLITYNGRDLGYPIKMLSFSTINTLPMARNNLVLDAPSLTFADGKAEYIFNAKERGYNHISGACVFPYGTGESFSLGIINESDGVFTFTVRCASNSSYAKEQLQLRIALICENRL